MVVTLTRAKPSCSSAKIFHAESEFQCRESSALLSFAWLGWICSVPTQLAAFSPRAGWFPSHWDSVCWWCGWFTEARCIQPHELGFLLHERDSRKSHHCCWDCHKKEQRALGTLELDMAKELKGAEKNYWNMSPLTTWTDPQILFWKWLPSFLLVLSQHVAGAILLKRPFSGHTPKPPDNVLFFRLLGSCYRCPHIIYLRGSLGLPVRVKAPQISCSTRSPNIGIRKGIWWTFSLISFP